MNNENATYIIRPVRPEETCLLRDFLYEAIFVPPGVAPPAREIVDIPELGIYIDGFGQRKDDTCMVAESNGKVVGAVWARIMDDYGHIDNQTPSVAISLYKEYRNRGIGTRLMKEFTEYLRTCKYDRVSLSVQKSNYAVGMYLNLGFKIIKETDEEYIMVKELA